MPCRRYGEGGWQRRAGILGTPERPHHQAPAPRDPIAITARRGASDAFDRSVTDSLQRYADHDEPDYQDFVKAIRSRRLENARGRPKDWGDRLKTADRRRPERDRIGASRPGPDAGGRKNR